MSIIEPLVRDAEGYGVHRLIPDTDAEYIDLSQVSAFKGCKISKVAFEDDAPEALIARFFENDVADISDWIPTPPEPTAILIAVSDTDDGPYAWFISTGESHITMSGKTGHLAKKYCGLNLHLRVCESRAGFYIGTQMGGGPVSRESVEYFGSEEEATEAFDSGSWTQRQEP
jgi:hypothetical protein